MSFLNWVNERGNLSSVKGSHQAETASSYEIESQLCSGSQSALIALVVARRSHNDHLQKVSDVKSRDNFFERVFNAIAFILVLCNDDEWLF